MSIIGTGMAVLPCCTEGTWKRSAAPRVDWPVYPRRTEHNTVAEGGNRRWPRLRAVSVGLVELADDPEDAFDLHNKIGSDVFIAASTMAG